MEKKLEFGKAFCIVCGDECIVADSYENEIGSCVCSDCKKKEDADRKL